MLVLLRRGARRTQLPHARRGGARELRGAGRAGDRHRLLHRLVGRRPLPSRRRAVVDAVGADRTAAVRAGGTAADRVRQRRTVDRGRPGVGRDAGGDRPHDRQPHRLDRARRGVRRRVARARRCAGLARSCARRCAGSAPSSRCCSCSASRSPTRVRERAVGARCGARRASRSRSRTTRASCCGTVRVKIEERPWLGYGFGRRVLADELAAELHDPLLTHAHNTFASQWLQTGLVGMRAVPRAAGRAAGATCGSSRHATTRSRSSGWSASR